MKKILVTAFTFIAMSASVINAGTNDFLNILNRLGSGSSSDSTSTENNSGKSGLGALSGLLSGLLSTDDIDPASMVGTWSYSSPAVCFQSDNFLQKAGGAAAATAIEEKLAPYYKTAGITLMTLTVNEDHTFAMQVRKITLKGTITKDENGDIMFNFTALGKISLGSMKAYVTMTGKESMSIMFDVSKLMTIVKTVANVSGNSTIKSVTTLLESYDGICAGFKLSKQK
ncbi:MAG: DUF4923 family protein [Muribaculaceae bacterium]|nr:DUF4923 family protein [Muribaculaceae bacterium]